LKAIGFFLMEKKCAGFEFDYRKKKQKYEWNASEIYSWTWRNRYLVDCKIRYLKIVHEQCPRLAIIVEVSGKHELLWIQIWIHTNFGAGTWNCLVAFENLEGNKSARSRVEYSFQRWWFLLFVGNFPSQLPLSATFYTTVAMHRQLDWLWHWSILTNRMIKFCFWPSIGEYF
jgi:hypothetical protein